MDLKLKCEDESEAVFDFITFLQICRQHSYSKVKYIFTPDKYAVEFEFERSIKDGHVGGDKIGTTQNETVRQRDS